MIAAGLALLGALAVGARLAYPKLMERRAARRRKLGADGIIEGAASVELRREGAPGVLLLHGGFDTPQVVHGLATYLHEHGFSIRAPLLAGHGRSLAELSKSSSATWHRQVAEEYDSMRRSHSRLAVVGLSMGGALALKLASKRTDLPALVLLAPYVDMPAAIKRMAATAAYWGWLLPYFSSGGKRSVHDREAAARGLGHGVLTPAALRALFDVMTDAVAALPNVESPTLVIQSREDNRIAAAGAEQAFGQLGASEKRMVWTEGAGHAITVDYGRERVFELVTDWLETHLYDEGPARTRTGPSIHES